jgi:hypothetical protein
MDEARIQEIVDRVVARIGELPETPLEAVAKPAVGYVAPAPCEKRPSAAARRTYRVAARASSPTSTRP